jgi:hypothetical protein
MGSHNPPYLSRLLLPIRATGENSTNSGTAQINVKTAAAAIPVPVGMQGKKCSAGKLEQYMASSSPVAIMTTASVATINALKAQEATASRSQSLINTLRHELIPRNS